MRTVRLALVALAAAAVPALTATPAAARTVLATCGGTAPLQKTCSATGTFPSGAAAGPGCWGAIAGLIRVTLTSSTGTFSYDCLPVPGVIGLWVRGASTGTFLPGQAFTLTGEATGAGIWHVEYVMDD